jgi:hypothetical protein
MIIAINGKIGSGKDELGKNLIKSFGSDWEIKKFADKLKDVVCLLTGCTRNQLEDQKFKEKMIDKKEAESMGGSTWDKIKKGRTRRPREK